MKDKISINIISDVSCPWCIIGYRALSLALDELNAHDDVKISWLPFELNPTMPPEGQNRNDYIREKYGLTPEQGQANRDNLIKRGAELGYTFNFPDDGRVYNTFNAHRLIHWAKEHDLQTQLKLALFDLFFQKQGNPSDHQDLLKCVKAIGLDSERAIEILESDDYINAVKQDLRFAKDNGISSVPAFIFENKYLVSGGQPKEVFINALLELQKKPQAKN